MRLDGRVGLQDQFREGDVLVRHHCGQRRRHVSLVVVGEFRTVFGAQRSLGRALGVDLHRHRPSLFAGETGKTGRRFQLPPRRHKIDPWTVGDDTEIQRVAFEIRHLGRERGDLAQRVPHA